VVKPERKRPLGRSKRTGRIILKIDLQKVGGSPLVRRSGGSCKLVQEISFHIVKFLNFWYFNSFYDDNQFICHCKCKTIAKLCSVYS
jgi:hypothetical protein